MESIFENKSIKCKSHISIIHKHPLWKKITEKTEFNGTKSLQHDVVNL